MRRAVSTSQSQLASAPLANTRSAVVTSGRMIQIRRARSDLVSILPDASHLLVIDLLHAVRVVMIVGMQARRVIHLVVELQRLGERAVRIHGDVVKLGAYAIRTNDVDGICFVGLVIA